MDDVRLALHVSSKAGTGRHHHVEGQPVIMRRCQAVKATARLIKSLQEAQLAANVPKMGRGPSLPSEAELYIQTTSTRWQCGKGRR
eukprot:4408773-Amphidinium_carterae.1